MSTGGPAVGALLLFAFAVFATAAEPQAAVPLLPSQYVIDEWTNYTGMPEETVVEMARIPNDYLLLATPQGVLRFDGQQFDTIYPDVPKASIQSISWDPELGVYCSIVGYGIARLEGKRLILTASMPRPGNHSRVLRRDRQKRLVMLDGAEVYRESVAGGHRMDLWRQLPEQGYRMVAVPDGSWLISAGKRVMRVADGEAPRVVLEAAARIESLFLTAGGDLLIGTKVGLDRYRLLPGGHVDGTRTVESKLGVFAIAESRSGELWLGTERGLHRLQHGELWPFNSNIGMRNEPISSVLCDDDGSIWAAYATGSIFRLKSPRFPNWSTTEGLIGGVVKSIQHDGEGGLWALTQGGVNHIGKTGAVRSIPGEWRDMNPQYALLDGPSGSRSTTLWVMGTRELRSVDIATGAVSRVPLPQLPRSWLGIHRKATGEIWILNHGGQMFARRNGGWVPLRFDGLPVPESRIAMAEGPDGITWLTVRGIGLYRLAGGKATPVAPAQPESRLVHAIYPDREGNVWLGLEGAGLALFEDGHIKTYPVDTPVQMNSAYFIAEDTAGSIWFGLRAGLLRISKAPLLDYFHGTRRDVPLVRYTGLGGLPSGNFGVSGNINHARPASILWMPHLRGVARVDAAHVPSYRTPPQPHIDQVLVDEVPLKIVPGGGMQVPAGAQRITIGFHGTFLPEPLRVVYRYQLEGFQVSPVGPYSQREATFTHLPPGTYTFRLWSANSDGAWNPKSLNLRFTVAPFVYQTLPFRIALVLVVAASVYGAFVWRTRLLRRDKEDLETRVEARTRELQQARVAAENAAKVKSEFLATMSHEIRTPLHGVLGTLELLAERPLDGEEREYVRTARNSGESLLELLNDVLDLSRLEAGHSVLHPEEFAFPELFRDVIEAFRHAAAVKGLELKLRLDDVPPRVVGDSARLRQILSNLVGNAIKFTEQGWVELNARGKDNGDGRAKLRISVRDTGVGLDPAKVSGLFQPFFQVDGSSKRRFGGTGLGLAICRRLCEEMGGTIGVKSEPDRGADFYIDLILPVGVEHAPAADTDIIPTRTTLKGRVLLVEDNRVNQMVASRMLTRLGCSYDIAVDGIDGVEHASREAYDAVLMDCHMPRATGAEATKLIRNGGGVNFKTPIIALTAGSSNEERDACLEAGMDDFITKPYALAQLHSVLARYLRDESAMDSPMPTLESQSGQLNPFLKR